MYATNTILFRLTVIKMSSSIYGKFIFEHIPLLQLMPLLRIHDDFILQSEKTIFAVRRKTG